MGHGSESVVSVESASSLPSLSASLLSLRSIRVLRWEKPKDLYLPTVTKRVGLYNDPPARIVSKSCKRRRPNKHGRDVVAPASPSVMSLNHYTTLTSERHDRGTQCGRFGAKHRKRTQQVRPPDATRLRRRGRKSVWHASSRCSSRRFPFSLSPSRTHKGIGIQTRASLEADSPLVASKSARTR